MAYNTRADQKGQFILHNGTNLFRVDSVAITTAANGVTGGYTANGGTTALVGGKHTGGTGSSAYTIGDIIANLKSLGLLAP